MRSEGEEEGRVERQGVCVEVCVSPVFPCFENINKIRVWRQYKCMSLCVDSKVSSVYLLALIESFPSSLFKQFFFSKSVGFIQVKDLLGSLELL